MPIACIPRLTPSHTLHNPAANNFHVNHAESRACASNACMDVRIQSAYSQRTVSILQPAGGAVRNWEAACASVRVLFAVTPVMTMAYVASPYHSSLPCISFGTTVYYDICMIE